MTQEELADRVTKSQRWVSNLENDGIKDPKIPILQELSRALAVDTATLILASRYAIDEKEARRIAEGTDTDDVDQERDPAIEALADVLLTTIEVFSRLPETPARREAIRRIREAMKGL